MAFLEVSVFNVVCTIAGCMFVFLGLVSHLVQERFFISMPGEHDPSTPSIH
jgi:hypothetical protein